MAVGSGRRRDTMKRWLEATKVRRSYRSFDAVPASAESLDSIAETCEGFRPFGDARVVLVPEPSIDVFTGIFGGYGRVTGAPHVLVVVTGATSSAAQAHAGYVGEAAVLEATAQGLQSCWIGGFFDPKRAARLVETEGSENVVAVIAIGHAGDPSATDRTWRALAHSRTRKSLDEIAAGSQEWPGWALAAAECVRVAPSAMNRQPWRLRYKGGAIVISRDNILESPRVSKTLDCGIAMLHAELGAFGEDSTGRWSDLDRELDVARFEVRPPEQ